jgi:hypothetical protein
VRGANLHKTGEPNWTCPIDLCLISATGTQLRPRLTACEMASDKVLYIYDECRHLWLFGGVTQQQPLVAPARSWGIKIDVSNVADAKD